VTLGGPDEFSDKKTFRGAALNALGSKDLAATQGPSAAFGAGRLGRQ
jgi:hypothetical protein